MLEQTICQLLASSDAESLTAETIHARLRSDGHAVSRDQVEAACDALVDRGRIDFLRHGSTRRFVLLPGRPVATQDDGRHRPPWLTSPSRGTPSPRPSAVGSTDTASISPRRELARAGRFADSRPWERPLNYQFVENRPATYWRWYRLALYLLFSLDLLTTLGATAIYGTAAEINPVMVWTIEHGPVAVIGLHLLALVAVVYAFSWVIDAIQWAPDPYDIVLEVVVEVWIGLLLLVGLLVVANNTAVILLGQSLL